MKQTLKYSDITINGVELTAKTVESQRKKYLMHFQNKIKPVIDSEHTFPFFIVEHDPTYNKVDRFVYFDSDGNWRCGRLRNISVRVFRLRSESNTQRIGLERTGEDWTGVEWSGMERKGELILKGSEGRGLERTGRERNR